MSLKKTLVKNTSFNLFSYFFLAIASLITIPILLKNLGAGNFGLYVLLNSVIPLVSVLDLGIGAAALRAMSLPDVTKEESNHLWRNSFSLYLGTGIFASLISFIVLVLMGHFPSFRTFTSTYLLMVIIVQVLTIMADRVSTHLLILPQARQKFEIFSLRNIIVGSGNTIFTAILSFYTPDILSLFILQLCFYIGGAIFLWVYCQRYYSPLSVRPQFTRTTVNKLLNFGLKNTVGKVASQFESQLSKIMIGGLVSATAAGVFSIPQTLIIKGAGAVSQLSLSLFPLSASLTKKDRIAKLKKLIILLELLILVIGIAVIVFIYSFGGILLTLWLKNPQVEVLALPLLKILSWYFALTTLSVIPSTVLDSINLPHIPSFFAVLTLVVEAAFLFWLLPTFGLEGAALAITLAAAITVPSLLAVFAYNFSKFEKKVLTQ